MYIVMLACAMSLDVYWVSIYKLVSVIKLYHDAGQQNIKFRTGAAIYTAAMVARSTGRL
jgi:hypothetical protein